MKQVIAVEFDGPRTFNCAYQSQLTDLENGIIRGPTSVAGLGAAVRARERIMLDALAALVAPRMGGNKREQLSKARSNARKIIAAFSRTPTPSGSQPKTISPA